MKKNIFMNLKNKWIIHLKENNMSYYEHMLFAVAYGCTAMLAGICLIIHAILPCFFQYTGSNLVKKLVKVFSK